MNREIKFRVWVPNGDNPQARELKGVMACWEYLSKHFTLFRESLQKKDGMIPLQYTGLKDKNGKEIYEGDILTAEEYIWKEEGKFNYHGEVVFRDAAFFVKAHCVNPKKQGISHGLFYDFWDADFEIIGNIYENPELLTNN